MKILKDQLTPKERKILYKQGKEVDRIPCSLSIGETSPLLYGININDYYFSPSLIREVESNNAKIFGADNMGIGPGLRGIGEALGSILKYPKDSVCFVDKPILKDYSALESLDVINPYKDGRLPIIIEALKLLTDEFSKDRFIGTSIGGPLSTAVAIRGSEDLLKDIIKNKDNLHRLLEFSVECILRYVEVAFKECGVGISLSDPVASGNLLSIKQFREFGKPYLIKVVEGIKAITGSAPSLHMCGKTKDRWKDLCDIGITSFSVDNCEDLHQLKNAVGTTMSISGNVPPVEVLRNGSPNQVITAAKECLLKASDSPNGFTLGAGCQIPVGTTAENLHGLMYAARFYGSGAIKGQLCKGLSINQ